MNANMKTNFKTGEKIKVTKAGMFKDLEGTVLANNTDTPMKPLKVVLADLGTWSFSYSEVISLSKESSLNQLKTPEKITKVETPIKAGKRAYNRKTKNEQIKVKRSYNKKAK